MIVPAGPCCSTDPAAANRFLATHPRRGAKNTARQAMRAGTGRPSTPMLGRMMQLSRALTMSSSGSLLVKSLHWSAPASVTLLLVP
jgi:hypothetical protein